MNLIQDDNALAAKQLAAVSILAEKRPNPRILVVDDEDDRRQLSFDVLVDANYEVDAAVDGVDGWELLLAKHFDLVITDNKMPRMTGVELIAKLRHTRLPLPVIMATSQLPTLEFERKPWLRPDAFLQRPFSNEDLLVAVKKVLRTDGPIWSHTEMLPPKLP